MDSQKIYTSMEPMSSNIGSPRKDFGDSSQLANLILDSRDTCHMTPEISYFISGSLVEMNKCIAFAERNCFTAKKQ